MGLDKIDFLFATLSWHVEVLMEHLLNLGQSVKVLLFSLDRLEMGLPRGSVICSRSHNA